jgi:tetratricopeptide (TPR) repeat protein
MNRAWFLIFVILILIWGAYNGQAFATSPADIRKAERYDQIGKAFFIQGKLQDAKKSFLKAYELDPIGRYAFNIAKCSEKMNDLQDAYHYYKLFLKHEPQTPDRDTIEKRLKEIESLLPPEMARVNIESTPEEARVYIDEMTEEPHCVTPCSLEVPTGKHVIYIVKFDYAIVEKEIIVARDEPQESLMFKLEKKISHETETRTTVYPEKDPAVHDKVEIKEERKGLKTAGWILLGIGGGGLITGTVLYFIARSAINEVNDYNLKIHTVKERENLKTKAKNQAIGSFVCFGIGGAAVITGIIFLVVSLKHTETPHVWIEPRLSPNGMAVLGTIRY